MKKTVGLFPALALALAALVVGACGMWALQTRAQLRGFRSLAMAHELEVTGLCASGLTLTRNDDRERLARLLEQRLDSALDRASTLTGQGVRLGIAGPNLRDSVRRAAIYYSSSGNLDRQRRAETLYAELKDAGE